MKGTTGDGASYTGPETDFWPYVQAKHWIVLFDDIDDSDRTLMLMLRGLVFEAARDNQVIKGLTIDEIRHLMPKQHGRVRSRTTVKRSLGRLRDQGLVIDMETTDPVRGGTVRRYQPVDTPPPGRIVWKTPWEKLRTIRDGGPGSDMDQGPTTEREPRSNMNQVEKGPGSDMNQPQVKCGPGPFVDHGSDLQEQGARPPYKNSSKNSSSSSRLQTPGLGQAEDDEETLRELLDAFGVHAQGRHRKQMLKAVSALRADGWNTERIKGIFAHTQWGRVVVPDRYVMKSLEDAVGTESAQTPQESIEVTLEALRARRTAQLKAIAECQDCGDFGRTDQGWHGHDEESLKDQIYVLENPKTAQATAEMNRKNFRVA